MDCSLGVVYIAVGDAARNEYERSRNAINLEHVVLTNKIDGLNNVQSSRWHKTSLYEQSPFEHTLYLDADTRVKGDISVGLKALRAGWDMVIVPSSNQGKDFLWHVGADERERTQGELGYPALQLQGGVFWFRRNERVQRFFALWRQEWRRWQGQDQAALLRALQRQPLKIWLLGLPFNGGAVIGHLFGRARA